MGCTNLYAFSYVLKDIYLSMIHSSGFVFSLDVCCAFALSFYQACYKLLAAKEGQRRDATPNARRGISGDSGLRAKLSKEIFEPITQRIDFRFKIPSLDLSQTTEYITRHMNYAGETRQIFTNGAVQKIFTYANGIPRKINKVCYLSLMAAAQRQTRLIEDSLVTYAIDQELTW